MKKIILSTFTIFNILAMFVLWLPNVADAFTFNPNNLIDNGVFENSNAMSAGQIDAFLNSFSSSCISSNHGFSTPNPQGWSDAQNKYTYGGNVTAGAAIHSASVIYHINPQVILSTMQKEQSLVTGGAGCYPNEPNPSSATSMTNKCGSGTRNCTLACTHAGGCMNIAMGYGCPSYCDAKDEGFSVQLTLGTWLLRFGQQRAYGILTGYTGFETGDDNFTYTGPMTPGNRKRCASCSTIYFDGTYTTVNGAHLNIANGSTASLYNFTPFTSGNQNFDNIYVGWFGSPFAGANDYALVSSSATALDYEPGGTGSVTLVLQNTGLNTWYSDNNLPGGRPSTRLATVGYSNTPFMKADNNTLYTQNQIMMTPDTVDPGQNATFTFNVQAPYQTTSSNIHLVPIVGGAFLKDKGMNFTLSTHAPSWNPTASSIDARSLLPNQSSHAHFTVQNNSNITWYSDGNVPAGLQPTRLATFGYANSPFADTSDPNWLGTRNQIKMNEVSVAPGQTATFDATFIGPVNGQAIASNFHFGLIVGGVYGQDYGLSFGFNVPAAQMSFTGLSATNPPATMSPGQTATVNFTVKNTGNVVWQDEQYMSGSHALRLIMSHPVYRSSAFYDSSDTNWLSIGQVKKPTGTTMPGQTITFTWTWKAPAQTSNYSEPFQLAVGGAFYPDYGSVFSTTVQ